MAHNYLKSQYPMPVSSYGECSICNETHASKNWVANDFVDNSPAQLITKEEYETQNAQEKIENFYGPTPQISIAGKEWLAWGLVILSLTALIYFISFYLLTLVVCLPFIEMAFSPAVRRYRREFSAWTDKKTFLKNIAALELDTGFAREVSEVKENIHDVEYCEELLASQTLSLYEVVEYEYIPLPDEKMWKIWDEARAVIIRNEKHKAAVARRDKRGELLKAVMQWRGAGYSGTVADHFKKPELIDLAQKMDLVSVDRMRKRDIIELIWGSYESWEKKYHPDVPQYEARYGSDGASLKLVSSIKARQWIDQDEEFGVM